MSTRPSTLVPLAVVVTFLLVGAAACSGSPASVRNASDDPSNEDVTPTNNPPCEATATIDGVSYHVIQAVSVDYGVNPTVQLSGSGSDCNGDNAKPMTFHGIARVAPAWALCGLVDGRWRVFLSDQVGQVPADSALAHIVLGQ
jgi:hypothetical protein